MDKRLSKEQNQRIINMLGKKLKVERIMIDETVLGLSDNLDMSNSHLSRIENGVVESPTITTYLNICNALGIKPSEFFSIIDNYPPFNSNDNNNS